MRLVSTLVLSALPALSQCVLCRTAAGAQGEKAASALNFAIVLMLIPAVALFCGVYLFAFRFRNSADDGEFEDERW